MRFPILLLALAAACGGKPVASATPAADREVRLLDANDVALSPVLFAAAKYIFNPDSSRSPGGFGGVYVNKRHLPALSKEIASYVGRNGWAQPKSRPGDCEADLGPRATAPGKPTVPASQTGGAPNPASQPQRTTASELCNPGGSGGNLNFTSVRIASDTAYVEIQFGAGATRCLPLTVDQVAGGWVPALSLTFAQMKTSKIGQCGK
jgi:hypothetical protein